LPISIAAFLLTRAPFCPDDVETELEELDDLETLFEDGAAGEIGCFFTLRGNVTAGDKSFSTFTVVILLRNREGALVGIGSIVGISCFF
tara:strand:+ start:295 stop:561 length:267 start_codon:yes stop_codon:yes gene_type:complete